MKIIDYPFIQRTTLISIFTDFSALLFIYLVPAITHLVGLPVYFIEPMRLMLVLALVHTNKKNAYILALTMPLFSLIISGHPVVPKTILIAVELALNVFLFYALLKKIQNIFPAIFFSIIFSKIIYYFLKFILMELAVINTELFSTPVLIQIVTTILFSLYLYKFFRKTVQ